MGVGFGVTNKELSVFLKLRMHRQAQKALFVATGRVPLADSISDLQKDLRKLDLGVLLKTVDRSALIQNIQTLRIPWSISQLQGASRAIDRSVFINRDPVLPPELWKCQRRLEIELAVDRRCNRAFVAKLANLDVPERYRIAVVLETKMSLTCFGKTRKLRELAFGHQLIPPLVPQIKLVVHHPIHRDLTAPRRDAKKQLIPLPGRSRRIRDLGLAGPTHWIRLIHLIEPTGLLRVVPLDVVLDLDLRSTMPRCWIVLGHMEHQAAITTLGNVVLER